MTGEPYIVEMAILLLLAFVLGGLAGFWARRWFKPSPVVSADGDEMTPADAPGPAPAARPAEPPQSGEVVSETGSSDADKPPLLTAARNGAADDLKKIKGIGPRIEKTLNGLGVYHYDQIAAWDAAAMAWVDDKLAFHGRIARENWVPQARELVAANGPSGA